MVPTRTNSKGPCCCIPGVLVSGVFVAAIAQEESTQRRAHNSTDTTPNTKALIESTTTNSTPIISTPINSTPTDATSLWSQAGRAVLVRCSHEIDRFVGVSLAVRAGHTTLQGGRDCGRAQESILLRRSLGFESRIYSTFLSSHCPVYSVISNMAK